MIVGIWMVFGVLFVHAQTPSAFPLSPSSLDDIILDIYSAATELGETDYEQLQSDLYAIHASPIDLNHTSEEELSRLCFLSPRQIDDLLAYADRHPFVSLYELRLIPSLADYEIRDLLPFVRITNDRSPNTNDQLYPKEVFAYARHELLARVDARNIEGYEGSDPVYTRLSYRFDFRRKVVFGARLNRPAGGAARDLQYGAYLQLTDIAPHLHTVVAGNFQASFGQGLVLAPVFHSGKSMYVASAGMAREGLRYYSSVDGEGLHGAGATLRWNRGKQTRLDLSVLYSMKRTNDSVWHHLVGANLTFRHKRLQLGVTAIENIWTDSVRPYRDAAYNMHYFRGTNQAVLGASARYNHGWFDAFAELATAQNHPSPMTNRPWGFALIAGSRFYPASGVSLIALYRYYSPFFDNVLGYAFSETSRINDENGGYLGFEVSRWRSWRWIGYADLFYFSGPKYGIPEYPSFGYDFMTEARYTNDQSPVTNDQWGLSLRLRTRKKGASLSSARAQFHYTCGALSLRTTAEANYVDSYGLTIYQDISYDFQSPVSVRRLPLSLHFRAQFFDAREWANRIYVYEHDVLYAYSIPAVYGLGGRAYLCLRWQIIPQLALYFRLSETLCQKQWAVSNNRPQTRTDLHLLLRAKL